MVFDDIKTLDMHHVSSQAIIYIKANYLGFLQEFNLFMQIIEFYNFTNNNIPLAFVSDQSKFDCTSKYKGLHNVALKIHLTPS